MKDILLDITEKTMANDGNEKSKDIKETFKTISRNYTIERGDFLKNKLQQVKKNPKIDKILHTLSLFETKMSYDDLIKVFKRKGEETDKPLNEDFNYLAQISSFR